MAPRLSLKTTVQDIINSNPFLAFDEPKPDGEDDWGFIPRKPDSDYVDWDEFLPDRQAVDLYAEIEKQVDELGLDPFKYRIASAWMRALDEHGRVTTSALQVASECNCSPGAADTILALLQTLDPRGIFARDLFECYRLQLHNRPDVQDFVTRFLPLIITKGIRAFCAETGNCPADVHAHLSILKPLRRTFKIPAIEAPVHAELEIKFHNDKPTIEWIEPFHVRKQYRDLRHDFPDGVDKWNEATLLERMLIQRRDTIMRVVKAIIEAQDKFIHTLDPADLEPLTQIDIANRVNCHHTTVGRAIAGKSVLLRRREIMLESFFSTRVGRDDATVAVQAKLRDALSKYPQLSDSIMVHVMKQKYGITIARRTITKYRAEMGLRARGQR